MLTGEHEVEIVALRRLELLRPVCRACQHRAAGELTVELCHEPGEELQPDWKELHSTP